MEREVLQRLLDQAFLYDDPSAYQAGVHAAWGVLARTRDEGPPPDAQGSLLREAVSPSSAAG